MTLSQLVTRRREDFGMSKADLARAMGVHQSTVGMIEMGANLGAHGKTRAALCKALELTPGVIEAAVRGIFGETMVGGSSRPKETAKTCGTCRHYLGNGCCGLDLEAECGAGGFEAWESDPSAAAGGSSPFRGAWEKRENE